MHRLAAVGKERVEDWAQNTALWHTSVQGEDRGVMVVDPDCGLLVRKSRNQLQREGLMLSSVSLEINLDGITVLKAELKSINNILTYVLLLSR